MTLVPGAHDTTHTTVCMIEPLLERCVTIEMPLHIKQLGCCMPCEERLGFPHIIAALQQVTRAGTCTRYSTLPQINSVAFQSWICCTFTGKKLPSIVVTCLSDSLARTLLGRIRDSMVKGASTLQHET